MRGFLIGLVLVVGISLTILSIRPGGIRRQLRFAARRFRIFLVLGGIYVLGAGILRLAFPSGPGSDFGPPVLAVLLLVVFLIVGRDPPLSKQEPSLRP